MPDTRTGTHYQDLICTQLRSTGWQFNAQVVVGEKPDGGRHRIDYIAWRPADPDRKTLISCKVQNWGGSAEEKLAYEVIKLLHTMRKHAEYQWAYLVLGGTGWSRGVVNFMKSGLREYIPGAERVTVYTTDEMITRGLEPLR